MQAVPTDSALVQGKLQQLTRIGWPTRSIVRPNMQSAPETKCLLANHGNMHQLEALQV